MNITVSDVLSGSCDKAIEDIKSVLDAVDDGSRTRTTGTDEEGTYVNIPMIEDHQEAAQCLVAVLAVLSEAQGIYANSNTLARAMRIPMEANLKVYPIREDLTLTEVQDVFLWLSRAEYLEDHLRAWSLMWSYLNLERSLDSAPSSINGLKRQAEASHADPHRPWNMFAQWCDAEEGVEVGDDDLAALQAYILDGDRTTSGGVSVEDLEPMFVSFIRALDEDESQPDASDGVEGPLPRLGLTQSVRP